jgi:hypothetical protein
MFNLELCDLRRHGRVLAKYKVSVFLTIPDCMHQVAWIKDALAGWTNAYMQLNKLVDYQNF